MAIYNILSLDECGNCLVIDATTKISQAKKLAADYQEQRPEQDIWWEKQVVIRRYGNQF